MMHLLRCMFFFPAYSHLEYEILAFAWKRQLLGTNSNFPGSVKTGPGSICNMDYAWLEVLNWEYLACELSQSDKRSSSSQHHQCTCMSFCEQYSIKLLLWMKCTACLFTAFLAQQELKLQTISAYVTAVEHFQFLAGYNPHARMVWWHVQYVQKGV